jgi:hypothetical protein
MKRKNDNHISIEIRIYALLEMDQNSQRRNYFQASSSSSSSSKPTEDP